MGGGRMGVSVAKTFISLPGSMELPPLLWLQDIRRMPERTEIPKPHGCIQNGKRAKLERSIVGWSVNQLIGTRDQLNE